MHLNTNLDPHDKSTCILTYEEDEQWLVATWSGYVDMAEALRGAEAYLRYAAHMPCTLLLNDNTQLQGPWFDGLGWLARVWVPQAARLGLRYVAHVVPTDRHFDVLPARLPLPVPFELQIFQTIAEARHWLHQCRAAHLAQL